MPSSVMAHESLGFTKAALDFPIECLRLKLPHTIYLEETVSGIRKELAILESALLAKFVGTGVEKELGGVDKKLISLSPYQGLIPWLHVVL